MNIFFDTLLNNPGWQNQVSKEDADFYKMVRDFVLERLAPLTKFIENEEIDSATKNKSCYIEIIMESPPSISFRNYSLSLRNKMTDCFSEEDGEYLNLLIYQRLTRLLEKK